MTLRLLVCTLAAGLLAACVTQPTSSSGSAASAPSATSKPGGRLVKSKDGSFEGEVYGTPAPGSKFASLQIGMQMSEVQAAMGRAPDRFHTYESGKRWIPFYFGNDARRMQALYQGAGCLIFTDGNAWGGAGGELITIEYDASGACYQP